MLVDLCVEILMINFVSQWLYLRNLDAVWPDLCLFFDFDDNLW